MANLFKSSAFKPQSGVRNAISDNAFYLIIGVMVVIGLITMSWAANYAVEEHIVFSAKWQFWVVGLVIPILGILLSGFSNVPLFSFIGYMMVTIPVGIILGPALQKYDPAVITRAALLTMGIVILMTTVAFIKPSWFENMGGPLFSALIGLLLVRIAQVFVPELQDLRIVDYISAGIFSLYVGYDMYRAQHASRTVDAAIDIAVALYLDVVNLFLSVLGDGDD
jgi:FtsH-binding integral membrane protein